MIHDLYFIYCMLFVEWGIIRLTSEWHLLMGYSSVKMQTQLVENQFLSLLSVSFYDL